MSGMLIEVPPELNSLGEAFIGILERVMQTRASAADGRAFDSYVIYRTLLSATVQNGMVLGAMAAFG